MFSKNMLAAVAGLAVSMAAEDRRAASHSKLGQCDRSQFAPRTQRKILRRIRAKIAKASRKRNRVRRSLKRVQSEKQALNFLVAHLAG